MYVCFGSMQKQMVNYFHGKFVLQRFKALTLPGKDPFHQTFIFKSIEVPVFVSNHQSH
jgi:hypothetical protein